MRTPPLHLLLAVGIIAGAALLRIADPEPVARLRLSIFDTYLRLSPRVPDPAYPVRIVDIDEASLARLGQWPWPRTKLAQIVDTLAKAGARTIALDLVLAEPDRLSPDAIARDLGTAPGLSGLAEELARLPSNDARLADAMRTAPVVLGVAGDRAVTSTPQPPRAKLAIAGDDPRLFVPGFPGGIGPVPALGEAAAGLGAVNWLPAHDQIVRRVPLLLAIGETLYPSLGLEALRIGERETTLFIRSSGGSSVSAFGQQTGVETVRVGKTVLPTDGDGQLWLNFSEPDAKRYIPAYRVLDGSLQPAEVKGRDILIGASATGLLDLRATPLAASVPGVEIHAQALEQMRSGENLVRPAYATGAELLFLIAGGALVAALIRRAGPVAAAITGTAAIAAVGVGSWLAFAKGGTLFDPVYPSLALVALYISGSLLTYIQTEADRARVRNAFSHYIAPSLVDELARNHDKLKLGGETREVTLLFSDVRGFSKLSEGMDAETLIRFVNRLFTPLSDVILAHKGTIDKFMGDAVMAFWNAPVRDPEHAANACRAALAMLTALADVNRERAAEAASSGEASVPVRIGVGLNTGDCCVGNVGSPQRFDYSVLGDSVNVAARLEEATKIYGATIVTGARTAERAPGMAFLEIGSAPLRGKERRERLFALVGDEMVAASDRFRELAARHAALRAALDTGDTRLAREHLARCAALAGPEIEGLIAHYAKRLEAAA